jgi:23S rRNA pseudouridine1911/1915/1917 synthase
MSYLQHPLVGDTAYGGRARIPKGASQELIDMIRGFDRQALHAAMLRFEHPVTGEVMEFHAPIPDDMIALSQALRDDERLLHEDEY